MSLKSKIGNWLKRDDYFKSPPKEAKFNEAELFSSIKKLEPKKGDIIVIRTPYILSDEICEAMRLSFEKCLNLGPRFKFIVCDQGRDLEILRPCTTGDKK
jgi:hypothetical protein